MKDSTPEWPPFTRRQLDLLEELKAEIEKRDALSALDPEVPKINERIDELSVKALASGLMKGRPAESRRPGEFFLDIPTLGGRLLPLTGEYEIKPGFGDFHPDLPPWAKNHFIEWIRMLRSGIRRADARKILRKTKIVGIETSMKRPVNMDLLRRALELRGYEVKDDPSKEDGPIPGSLGEALDKSLRVAVTDEMLRNVGQQSEVKEKKKTRTRRKELRSWNWVIRKLVEEGFLLKKISHQALKKMLKNRYPEWPWEEV